MARLWTGRHIHFQPVFLLAHFRGASSSWSAPTRVVTVEVEMGQRVARSLVASDVVDHVKLVATLPPPDYVFREDDVLLLVSHDAGLAAFTR